MVWSLRAENVQVVRELKAARCLHASVLAEKANLQAEVEAGQAVYEAGQTAYEAERIAHQTAERKSAELQCVLEAARESKDRTIVSLQVDLDAERAAHAAAAAMVGSLRAEHV